MQINIKINKTLYINKNIISFPKNNGVIYIYCVINLNFVINSECLKIDEVYTNLIYFKTYIMV